MIKLFIGPKIKATKITKSYKKLNFTKLGTIETVKSKKHKLVDIVWKNVINTIYFVLFIIIFYIHFYIYRRIYKINELI